MNAVIQPYDYYVVLDFEATCDNGPPPTPQEIIEYPALLLDGRRLESVGEFQSFVRPRHDPVLTSFCIELTGITQQQVDAAPPFPEVFEMHLAWLAEHGLDVANDRSGAKFAFILCGDWDLMKMLPRQCRACDPPIGFIPGAFRQWINLKQPFAAYMRLGKSPGLAGMLRKLDLEFEGRPHRGIDDCRNIARVARRMARDSVRLSTTTALPASAYPPVSLMLRFGDDRRAVTLERRFLKSLLRLAGARFKRRVSTIQDAQGRQITRDADLLDLPDGAELILS